jgi:hypothetical protein
MQDYLEVLGRNGRAFVTQTACFRLQPSGYHGPVSMRPPVAPAFHDHWHEEALSRTLSRGLGGQSHWVPGSRVILFIAYLDDLFLQICAYPGDKSIEVSLS